MVTEKKRRLTKVDRLRKNQKAALEKIFGELEEKYLTREKIRSRFLSGNNSENPDDTDIVNRLDLIDAVRENFKTSLSFGKFRRASRYLVMLETLCEKFLK
ncbi:MAG: hypothetical protein IK062_04645 [Selenomonadaceae bacterium]|nr:hypothetical protein [Selenomonadaceae bacterium]